MFDPLLGLSFGSNPSEDPSVMVGLFVEPVALGLLPLELELPPLRFGLGIVRNPVKKPNCQLKLVLRNVRSFKNQYHIEIVDVVKFNTLA